MMNKHIALSLLALVGLAPVALGVQPASATPTHTTLRFDAVQPRLQAQFDALVEAGFTGAVLLAQDGDIIWSGVAGLADPAQARAIDLETQFDIASVTKSLTGMMAADLMAQGVLSPLTRLGDVFADAPEPFASLTLHQMLTHSAGLVDVVGEDAEALSPAEQRARLYQTELMFAPGEGYRYSNLGYSLTAQILEAVSGQSYEALLEDYLARAGLDGIGYGSVYHPERAIRFEDGASLSDVSWGGPDAGWNLIGDGGLVASVQDLMGWALAYQSAVIVSADAYAIAHQPYQAEDPEGRSHYGYGLVVEDSPTLGRIYWHNGGARRFSSHWRTYADQGVTLIALTNQWDVSADQMVFRLSDAYFSQP